MCWALELDEPVDVLRLIKIEKIEGEASIICGGDLLGLFFYF